MRGYLFELLAVLQYGLTAILLMRVMQRRAAASAADKVMKAGAAAASAAAAEGAIEEQVRFCLIWLLKTICGFRMSG